MSVSAFNGLSRLAPEAWRKNVCIHLPSSGAARAWICREMNAPLLAVLPNSRAARDMAADASALSAVFRIPSAQILPELPIADISDAETSDDARYAERGEVMARWSQNGGILAATPGALMGPLSVGGDSLKLECGYTIARSRLIEWLTSKGYERVDIVWSPGQFTYRGGIVDIFDPKDAWPIRVEFFDDDVDTMRYFATDTQRSISSMRLCEIHALTSRRSATIESFFPQDMHVIVFEPAETDAAAENYEWLRGGVEREGESRESLVWLDILKMLAPYPRVRAAAKYEGSDIRSGIMSLPNFRGRRRDLDAYCDSLSSKDIALYVITESENGKKWAASRGARLDIGQISEGFCDSGGGIIAIGDLELSGVSLTHTSKRGTPIDWADRLLPGQWVVHEDYGIARYLGPERIDGPDGTQEYLVLEYAHERRLKIPVMHFHKISRYTATGSSDPTPDDLKGSKWRKMSAKAKEQAEAAARYLIDVYAKRELTKGTALLGDRAQETAFEEAFPYRETDDQIAAINDVMRDLERSTPMDRLLVGDVGYGKTEIALRAAARCVFSGMQVAVMAPTTILAQQHSETWSARFDEFGVRVESVSRFVSSARQKKILADTERGVVDILIGTHRMLGGDVKFRSLGLVIIDEEHRFGVMHKEHLKNAHPDVDVLMLSATPIPRSLNMSLTGLRDMSLLQTPPRARVPVITAVGVWSDELVKSAVLREKNRGGQVFYIHNRVNTIEREAMTLRRLFPKLAISVAHGQMQERELKETMERFTSGEIDILVCTTIVESGLDIPRANTLIVSDSQDLGLAQMHQLRGRVGRRSEQAFAFFLRPQDVKLSRDASERMEAIAAMGEFGAGYELAKKDLEIRGGGDIVGTAQHGLASRVGIQMYCDMLDEAIRRAKGEWRERTHVDVGMPSAIPDDYIPHESVRVALYRRLLWTLDIESLDTLREETTDRFGPLPRALEFLFDVARIKISGPELGIKKAICLKGSTTIECTDDSKLIGHRPPKGWFARPNGFLGPGGFKALGDFIDALPEH